MLLDEKGYLKGAGPAMPGEAAWGRERGRDWSPLVPTVRSGLNPSLAPKDLADFSLESYKPRQWEVYGPGVPPRQLLKMSVASRAQSSPRNIKVTIMPHTADTRPALESISISIEGGNRE